MKHLYFIAFLCLSGFFAHAQENEVGLCGGSATYFGDLNTNTSFRLSHPMVGLFYRYNYNPRLSIKGQASYGNVSGEDALSNNAYQRERNLSFFSYIYEAGVTGEFNFMDFNTNNPKDFFTPYLCTGFGVFTFNPETYYDGNVYRLQPLGTEGQGLPEYPDKKPYSLVSTAWIVGGGFKFRINRTINIFAEASERRTHTDYLDDVGGTYPSRQVLLNEDGPLVANLSDRSVDGAFSQGGQERGTPGNHDKYLFIEIGLSATFITYKCPYAPE